MALVLTPSERAGHRLAAAPTGRSFLRASKLTGWFCGTRRQAGPHLHAVTLQVSRLATREYGSSRAPPGGLLSGASLTARKHLEESESLLEPGGSCTRDGPPCNMAVVGLGGLGGGSSEKETSSRSCDEQPTQDPTLSFQSSSLTPAGRQKPL
ncbi:unnamed protein product [Pleuronectes platessa]|uniref:Uncharacterized protein n=1 Tax=Pleuronectes platessa TaxID=8262 RepID=A0A9N7YIS1_PLEPL|nr:unnamed protein product [Pleuronectes platessa]